MDGSMKKKIFITGGCGFIGCNAALFFYKNDWEVTIFDNLSRKGTENNLDWLASNGKFNFIKGDIRNYSEILSALKKEKFDFILHLAAQVAVTTSIINPREDFEINAIGTFNLLEAVRETNKQSFVLYSSTNKVYGKLEHLEVVERNGRHEYKDISKGVQASECLDFHSPYGCSKGAADQYIRDYARIYDLNTCVFRQSCIYGTRQFGVEDQGWVAWFTIAALLKKPISIYGDGKQVRDVLFVEDLVRAYESAFINRHKVNGKAFNMGGGHSNTLSLLELISILEKKLDLKLNPSYSEWRPGDQKVFIGNIDKFTEATGWIPATSTSEGAGILIDWVRENKLMLQSVVA